MFGEEELDSPTYSKWNVEIAPQFEFKFADSSMKPVVIEQNPKGYGELGSRIWDGSIALSRFLEKQGLQGSFKGKSCLELGTGTGLAGIVAARMGAEITLTDKASLLQLITHNINKNLNEEEKKRTKVAELFWGTGNPFSITFQIIIGADLTYDFDDLPVLIQTFKDVASKDTIIYIAYGKERAAVPSFFEQADANGFHIEYLDDDQIGHVEATSWSTHQIGIAKLTKKL